MFVQTPGGSYSCHTVLTGPVILKLFADNTFPDSNQFPHYLLLFDNFVRTSVSVAFPGWSCKPNSGVHIELLFSFTRLRTILLLTSRKSLLQARQSAVFLPGGPLSAAIYVPSSLPDGLDLLITPHSLHARFIRGLFLSHRREIVCV